MSVTSRVQILTDKAEELSVIAEYLRNPKLIEELRAETIKLNALSEDEAKRAAEGREFIRQHAGLHEKLQSDQERLEQERAAHDANVAAFNAHKDAVSKNMEDMGTMMAEKDAAHAETDKRQAEARKKLDDDIAAHNKAMAEGRAKLADELEHAANERKVNAELSSRLTLQAKQIRDKAEELRNFSVLR